MSAPNNRSKTTRVNRQQQRFIYLAEWGPRVSNRKATKSRVLKSEWLIVIAGLLVTLIMTGCAQQQWHTHRALPQLIKDLPADGEQDGQNYSNVSTET